jgi:ATP-binding cassette subfamily B protein
LTQFEAGAIELKNLSFNYPSRKAKVLNNFSLSIPAGKKIGLVGHSGCGKSTITNLLLRFYNLQEGQILIDGKPIDEYDILELRRQIGYVMQEPVLFNMSIKDNILYGQPDASDAKVHQIAEMANALTFIESNFEELTPEEQLSVVH